jgi:magnesium-transporting ATPase (P-type)
LIYNSFSSTDIRKVIRMIDIYTKELVYLFAICTTIFFVLKMYANKIHTTKMYTKKTYQTRTELYNFDIDSKELSNDNAIFLTQIKKHGKEAFLRHILYGYYAYIFLDPVNLFCTVIAIGQIYEYMDMRSIIPLSIVGTWTVINYVYSMSTLLSQQNFINNKTVEKIDKHDKIIELKQKDLKRGDIVRLSCKDEVPADILLLSSKVSVQELELTGEDIVILRSGLMLDKMKIDLPMITINHFNNTGCIEYGKTNYNYDEKNMIFRGTKIIDGDAYGMVIETGNDCKIYRIDNTIIKDKTNIQKKIMNICLTNLYLMLLITSVTSIIIFHKSMNEGYSYKRLWKIIRKMVLLFNTMVPLSMQFFFNTAAGIISKRIANKSNIHINRNGINAFQINPHFIVSDKTGTITTNETEIENIYQKDYKQSQTQLLLNVLACSEVQSHSVYKTLLKNDIIEERLINNMLKDLKSELICNDVDNESDSYIEVKNIGKYKRLLYKPYDYILEVKIGVIENGGNMMLHIQGTPESVNKYANDELKEMLDYIEKKESPNNVYKRIIAHASKVINDEELLLLRTEPLKVLKDMTNTVIYVFYDYIIKDIDKSISELLLAGKDFTLLTGDKMTSAIEIGTIISIIKDNKIYTIEKEEDLDNINNQDLTDHCIIINGKLFEQLADTYLLNKLVSIIKMSNKKIIYRATPSGKQIYVACLQKYFNKQVMMIGDGANDISAIKQSNIGVGIKKDNNINVQNVSEIVVDNWNIIPKFLKDAANKRAIIINIARWVMMKHMMTAFMLFAMLIISKFENIKDPASPYLMMLLNASMFVCMCIYGMYDVPIDSKKKKTFMKMIVRGIIFGVINGVIVLCFYGINKGINILVGLQAIILIMQLYWKSNEPNKIITISYTLIVFGWMIYIMTYIL